MAIAGEAPHVALAVTAPMAKQAGVDSQGAPRQAADDVIALGERAAIAARAELRGERTGILGAIGKVPLRPLARARQAPSTWRKAGNYKTAATRIIARLCATSARSSTSTPPPSKSSGRQSRRSLCRGRGSQHGRRSGSPPWWSSDGSSKPGLNGPFRTCCRIPTEGGAVKIRYPNRVPPIARERSGRIV